MYGEVHSFLTELVSSTSRASSNRASLGFYDLLLVTFLHACPLLSLHLVPGTSFSQTFVFATIFANSGYISDIIIIIIIIIQTFCAMLASLKT